VARNTKMSAHSSSINHRKAAAGLTIGLLSVTALGIFAASGNTDSGSGSVQVDTISASSRSGQAAGSQTSPKRAGQNGQNGQGGHQGHSGQGGSTPSVAYDSVGGATPAPTPSAAAPLQILGNNCDPSRLQPHDGFQAGNRCVSTSFGEVGATPNNPTLIISSAPRRVRAGQPFQIKVSTRNLVRDRFLAAAQGGYYKESSFLNEQSLQRGHFHTACRMLSSTTLAPDPTPGSVFFKATEDKRGGAAPDVVTVDVPAGLPSRGLAQCAAWAGDGSHRIPMMESVQAVPAFDSVRIWVR
jgi:hypothetical protein